MKLIIMVMTSLPLIGCSNVTQSLWDAADVLCTINGGVKYVSIDALRIVEVTCNNGAVFKHGEVIKTRNRIEMEKQDAGE